MPEKSTYDLKSAFDNSKLPQNKLSKERELEIEKKAKPLLKDALKKLEEQFSEANK